MESDPAHCYVIITQPWKLLLMLKGVNDGFELFYLLGQELDLQLKLGDGVGQGKGFGFIWSVWILHI